MSLVSVLEGHFEAIRGVIVTLDASSLQGLEAARLVEVFASTEKACAAGKALCAKRVEETGHFEAAGHLDAPSFLAAVSGETKRQARELLETAGELRRLPGLDESFRSGELSGRQAREIARAGAIDARAEGELLEKARSGSLHELVEACANLRATFLSKEDDERRHVRLRARRGLFSFTDESGGLSGRFCLAPEDGAVVIGRLESIAERLFKEARRNGDKESHASLLADALVALARGDGEGVGPPSYSVLMRIDLEALARGQLRAGEESMIEGAGHVPVSVVQSYLDEAKLRLVVTKGEDVTSVFSFARTIPAALKTALVARDRTCVVPGCSSSFHLEIDHIQEFARGGPTALWNLCRLCKLC